MRANLALVAIQSSRHAQGNGNKQLDAVMLTVQQAAHLTIVR